MTLHLYKLEFPPPKDTLRQFEFKDRARATNGKYGPVDLSKLKMIEKVLKSDYSANESLLIYVYPYDVIF